jgi:hypothetical protein
MKIIGATEPTTIYMQCLIELVLLRTQAIPNLNLGTGSLKNAFADRDRSRPDDLLFARGAAQAIENYCSKHPEQEAPSRKRLADTVSLAGRRVGHDFQPHTSSLPQASVIANRAD